jgi:hypothetical protein
MCDCAFSIDPSCNVPYVNLTDWDVDAKPLEGYW